MKRARFDLCFVLVDLAESPHRDWYRAAAKMMLASARHAFRDHDVRYVQMTDEASDVADGVDTVFAPKPKCEFDELAQYRGMCSADWALQTDRPAVLCDVDMLWNNDGIVQLFEPPSPDITLFTRQGFNLQPFNGGLIVTQPGQTLFWQTYRDMMRTMPKAVCGWWGDQIGYSIMMGLPEPKQNGMYKFGSRVAYLPVDLVAPAPKTKPTALYETSGMHFKGFTKRKGYMPDYYAMLQQSWSEKKAAE